MNSPRSSGFQLHLRGGRNSNGFRPPSGVPAFIWISAGGATLLFAYCDYAFLDEVPLTKRKRCIAMSPEWERGMGDREYRQLLHSFARDRCILPPHHPASVTLNRVGSRIAQASSTFASQQNVASYNSNPYTYTVVRSDAANAFVLPGNHVFVMTGLFRYSRDEDDLAAVIGHEMAHNIARHAGEKVSSSIVINVLARLSLLIDPSGLFLTLLLPAATLLRELPHSRVQEAEADQIGIQLAAQACYDPRAAKRVFAAMKEGHGEGGPEFLSTHPSHESRLTNFDKWIPGAMTIFEDGDRCRKIRRDMSLARQAAARRSHAVAPST
jgi:metalloendopeptidase OMA1, mitochondrial